jgi:hypothetical protein
LFAHGFWREMLARLVLAGLATVTTERPAEERVVGKVPAAADENPVAGEVHCDFLTSRG